MLIANQTHRCLHVMRPSRISVRKVPGLDFSLDTNQFVRQLVGMLVEEKAKRYTIFVASRSVQNAFQSQRFINIHRYDSSTDIWSWCGTIRHPCYKVLGVTTHRGRYLLLLKIICGDVSRVTDLKDVFQIKRFEEDSGRWETFPAIFPPIVDAQKVILFDHKGRLLLAGVCDHSFCVWEYYGGELEMSRQILQYPLTCFDVLCPVNPATGEQRAGLKRNSYLQIHGDCVYFGRESNMSEAVDHKMKYNLITRQVHRMPMDELQMVLVRILTDPYHLIFEPA